MLIYNILIRLYGAALFIASLFHKKAKLWIQGRKNWRQLITEKLAPYTNAHKIWLHCASLGEFEQARPVIEALKDQYPDCCIIVSFFSPSGYEIRKDYHLAQVVCYLPLDTSHNAQDLIEIIQPDLALFIKYEFWYHYIDQLSKHNIPVLLVSGAFRKDQIFFKWYGGFFKKLLSRFNYLLVQDEVSKQLLTTVLPADKIIVTGDTRYDRVVQIAEQSKSFPLIEKFIGHSHCLIAGSTWPVDEAILKDFLPHLPKTWKIIIAPHEIGDLQLRKTMELLGDQAVKYADFDEAKDARIMVIDNIGMLSSLYRYATIAVIGGGFNKSGIHNTLEAAVFGIPIIFGPFYKKFVEANELVAIGGAYPAAHKNEFNTRALTLIQNEKLRSSIKEKLLSYMQKNKGATTKTLRLIEAERYLTMNKKHLPE